MNSYEYIAEVKRINGLDTDYKAAKLLHCGQNKITQYKNGQSMDNETARQIAGILEIPVWTIIADMEAQRAKDEHTKKAWKMLAKLSKQSGKATANLLINLSILSAGSLYYILCKIAEITAKQKTTQNPQMA